MGCIESPGYFCTASETTRDVAEQYVETAVGSLQNHKLITHTRGSTAYNSLPPTLDKEDLRYLIEFYVDDFINLATPTS